MRERIKYMAIAITTDCNYQCFYCKKSGESMKGSCGTQNFEHLKKIIKVAYQVGITSFRITGGEPTMVSFLPELMEYVMSFGNTRIRLNTNGYKFDNFLNLLEIYRDRMEVIISVDSVNEYIGDFYYPKYLSEKVVLLSKELVRRKIKTRFNIVVTKSNISEVPLLITKALDLGVNVKLLDLKKQEYWHSSNISKEEFWNNMYQPQNVLQPFLEQISDKKKENYNEWISTGVPMGGYFKGHQTIQIKDSARGAQFSKFCIEKCALYHSCQEGTFSPFLSVGEVLHLSDCFNTELYWDLKGKSEKEIEQAFHEILTLFEDMKLIKK